WIAHRIRYRASRWNIGHEEISGASVGQPHNQTSDAISGVDYALCAMVIKEIVAATPKNVQGIGVGGVAGQIIVNLFAHVIDGNREIATAEGERVIDDGTVLCAALGSGAAKCIIGSPIETVLRDR